MQYKVPQNVEIEDKVVGPLTIRQFLILLVTAGIILVLNFFIGFMGPIFYMIAIFFGMLGLGLAFFKYGDQNAEIFVLSAFKTFTNPRKRIWQKEEPKQEASIKPVVEKPKEEEYISTRGSVSEARSHLEKLAEVVDSGGYSAIKGSDNTDPITQAYDILEKAEIPNLKIEKLLNDAITITPQREQLVSEFSSVKPDEGLKKTITIDTRIKKF